jgi:hypothetical protein
MGSVSTIRWACSIMERSASRSARFTFGMSPR